MVSNASILGFLFNNNVNWLQLPDTIFKNQYTVKCFVDIKPTIIRYQIQTKNNSPVLISWLVNLFEKYVWIGYNF